MDKDLWSYNTDDWVILDKSRYIDNQDYIDVKIDASYNILESRNKKGIKKEYIGFETPYINTDDINIKGNEITNTDTSEYIEIKLDYVNHIIEGITSEGVKKINIPIETQAYSQYTINSDEYAELKLDANNRIISAVKLNGDVIVGGVNINELKRDVDSNVIAIEYDASTYSIYAITGEDSNISLSMDASGNIYKETIID